MLDNDYNVKTAINAVILLPYGYGFKRFMIVGPSNEEGEYPAREIDGGDWQLGFELGDWFILSAEKIKQSCWLGRYHRPEKPLPKPKSLFDLMFPL